MGNPEIDLLYVHKKNSRTYTLNTKDIRPQLGEIPINSLDVLRIIKKDLQKIPE
jgi:hypothetical protein